MIVIVGFEIRLIAVIVGFIGVLTTVGTRPPADRQLRGPRTSSNPDGHRDPGRHCRPAIAV
jgi:hypothetical protein